MSRLAVLPLLFALSACSGHGASSQPPAERDVSVEIGVPGGPDGLDFSPLEPGAEVRLESFGQGGTHILLGIRSVGFGSRAYVALTLTNLATGEQTSSPAPVRPQLLDCAEAADICDLVPILAIASGIAAPGVDRNGLAVEIAADVHNDAGLHAAATQQIVLSTADLLGG